MSSSVTEKIEFPEFKDIIKKCKEKMIEKFPEYANSWQNVIIEDDWWKKRLNVEIKEIFKADTYCKQREEIIDAINILAMMFDHADHDCKEEYEIYKKTWRYNI